MELNITKVFRKEEISPRTNKPYTRLGIQCSEYGAQWLSGFGGAWNAHWKEGTKLYVGKDIRITEVAKDGKVYKNFERVDRLEIIETRLKNLEDSVNKLMAKSFVPLNKEAQEYSAQEEYNAEEDFDGINPDEVPF